MDRPRWGKSHAGGTWGLETSGKPPEVPSRSDGDQMSWLPGQSPSLPFSPLTCSSASFAWCLSPGMAARLLTFSGSSAVWQEFIFSLSRDFLIGLVSLLQLGGCEHTFSLLTGSAVPAVARVHDHSDAEVAKETLCKFPYFLWLAKSYVLPAARWF